MNTHGCTHTHDRYRSCHPASISYADTNYCNGISCPWYDSIDVNHCSWGHHVSLALNFPLIDQQTKVPICTVLLGFTKYRLPMYMKMLFYVLAKSVTNYASQNFKSCMYYYWFILPKLQKACTVPNDCISTTSKKKFLNYCCLHYVYRIHSSA